MTANLNMVRHSTKHASLPDPHNALEQKQSQIEIAGLHVNHRATQAFINTGNDLYVHHRDERDLRVLVGCWRHYNKTTCHGFCVRSSEFRSATNQAGSVSDKIIYYVNTLHTKYRRVHITSPAFL
jgi:hypothetical protein